MKVVGVSPDSVESHQGFKKKNNLNFPLLADPDGKVAAAYGVGSTFGFLARTTFAIGDDGKILAVFRDVKPAGHAEQVLRLFQPKKAAPPAKPAPEKKKEK